MNLSLIPAPPSIPALATEVFAELQTEALAIKDKAKSTSIVDGRGSSAASDLLKVAKDAAKKLDAKRKEYKQPFLDGGRAVDNAFGSVTDVLDEAVKDLNAKITAFVRAEEARIRAEQEKQRLEEEARRREEEQRMIEKAAQMERDGQGDLAEFILDTAAAEVQAPVPEPENVRVKIGGIGSQTQVLDRWVARIVDPMKVPLEIKVPEHANPIRILKPDEQMIAHLVKNYGVREIPGVEIVNEGTVRTR